jgi:hydrogenase maturation protein HypF
MEITGARIHITGIVQGVGFRPFVYGLAARMDLHGWVRNTSAGVDIQVDGAAEQLAAFASALRSDAPPLARIDTLSFESLPAAGFSSFEIVHSEAIADAFQPISPDVCICADCLRELFDAQDRRYRYPFINCTNCGPRFTIIADIPYDRPKTTMASFAMCPQCAAEYQDPLDRRFHAQPTACPTCGPHIWLEQVNPATGGLEKSAEKDAALRAAQRLLQAGKIVAIKGLGGFHLACDAGNAAAVQELRRRKLRVDKPFALMAADLRQLHAHCRLSHAEEALLVSRQRPIVILPRRADSAVCADAAPGQNTLGVMLPYTPLHVLLFAGDGLNPLFPAMLVMTSGNLSEEPIATDNDEARQRLASLADAFLMHNRPIHTRCDDSVTRLAPAGKVYPLRRSRGYAPFPVHLTEPAPPLLAVGAELKNTFCLTREQYAFLSHHIGDLENYETLQSFEDGITHFERLFRVKPVALAYDLHPDYMATRYALQRADTGNLPAVGVQHHHAHIAACMAEHQHPGDRPVIGVAFDGTGYGLDGAIWGGEFLLADYRSFRRFAHLAYIPLPGGDKAARQPWRIALAWLERAGIPWEDDLPPAAYAKHHLPDPALPALRRQLAAGVNAPLTSSMGRLFDAAAALAGVRQIVNYEAQAAIEFEALAGEREASGYEFALDPDQEIIPINPIPVFHAIVADLRAGKSIPTISAQFHQGLAVMVARTVALAVRRYGVDQVFLSGGVWQNMTLLRKSLLELDKIGVKIHIHSHAPANDAGLALGQAAIAVHQISRS